MKHTKTVHLSQQDLLNATSDTWQARLMESGGSSPRLRARQAEHYEGWYWYIPISGNDPVGPYPTEKAAIEVAHTS